MIASGEDELAGEVDLSRRPCSLVIVSGSRKETMSGSENEYFQKRCTDITQLWRYNYKRRN